MTTAAWLATALPAAPPALKARLASQVARAGVRDAEATPEALLTAAEVVLEAIVEEGCNARDGALDLLVADALVTYAFELASDEPGTLVARAERAMRRIAALADR
jgi:hypothetical protein